MPVLLYPTAKHTHATWSITTPLQFRRNRASTLTNAVVIVDNETVKQHSVRIPYRLRRFTSGLSMMLFHLQTHRHRHQSSTTRMSQAHDKNNPWRSIENSAIVNSKEFQSGKTPWLLTHLCPGHISLTIYPSFSQALYLNLRPLNFNTLNPIPSRTHCATSHVLTREKFPEKYVPVAMLGMYKLDLASTQITTALLFCLSWYKDLQTVYSSEYHAIG